METLTRSSELNLAGNDRNLLDPGKTPVGEFAENARDALLYSLVQAPINGVTQLVDKTLDSKLMEKCQLFRGPKEAEFGTPGWTGQVIGSTVGTALPFIAMHRMIGPGAAAQLEATNAYGLGRAALPHLGKAALAGGLYTALLQPVDESKEGNFWVARGRNGLTGALSAVTLTATAIGLKSTRIGLLNNDMIAGAISGVPAGLVSANSHSLLMGKGLANGSENLQAVTTFALGGAFLGGANMVHEHVNPTTGMQGVRTLEEMKKMADSTRTRDFEIRNQKMLKQELEGRPYFTVEGQATRFYDLIMEQFKTSGSTIPVEQQRLIAQGAQDMVTSLEALSKVKADYVVTVYGSARILEDSFAYQRTRYLSGALGREGMAGMTGGGVDLKVRRGVMDAGNRGFFEAGAESIGVSIQLPFEAASNPFQTIKLIHQEYYTRKEVLRKANAFVIEEGGLGSVDEAMELLCHLQCGKAPEAPVYFIGTPTYGPIARALENMVSRGLMSRKDLSLYRVVEDPRVIIKALKDHREGLRATRSAAENVRVGIPDQPEMVVPGSKPAH